MNTVANNVVCVPCPKGQYQPQRSQTECIACPADKKTTENTGSTKQSQCVGKSEATVKFLNFRTLETLL